MLGIRGTIVRKGRERDRRRDEKEGGKKEFYCTVRDSDLNHVGARSSAANQPSGAQACSGWSCQGGRAEL